MKIRNFFQYLLESKESLKVPFQISDSFSKLLSKIDSPITQAILDLKMSPQEFTLISSVGTDMVEFISASKMHQIYRSDDINDLSYIPLMNIQIEQNGTDENDGLYGKFFYKTNRIQIKIGRFIKKLFNDTFTDQEIEDDRNLMPQGNFEEDEYKGNLMPQGNFDEEDDDRYRRMPQDITLEKKKSGGLPPWLKKGKGKKGEEKEEKGGKKKDDKKSTGLTAAQKRLPEGLRKAIEKKKK